MVTRRCRPVFGPSKKSWCATPSSMELWVVVTHLWDLFSTYSCMRVGVPGPLLWASCSLTGVGWWGNWRQILGMMRKQQCLQLHISDVLLMCFPKIEVSSSIRDSAMSFILGLLLHCGRWRSSRLRQQSLMMVEATRSTSNSCTCNFNFLQRCPCRGLDVKTPLCY
jgi:hypothetical protein